MRRGKRPAAGGTGPGLPGPVVWAVGMPTTQPPRKPLSLPTHPAWDVLPGAAPDVTRGLSWATSAGHPSGCGSRGRRGQAGGAARCWCDVPVWRRRVRRGGIGCTKRAHKRVFPTEGGRSRLCVWFPDPAMTPPARLLQEDPLRGRRPLSRPYVGWVSGESRAEEENE